VPGALEVIRYAPEMRDGIIALQQGLWGSDPIRSAAYFEWKYEKNPLHAEPLIYLARADGRIVGMRGFFGTCWQGGGETVVGVYADDTVVAPEWRGRGVFQKIMSAALGEVADRGYGLAFNLSAGLETFVASIATGWKSIGSMRPVARVRDGGAMRRLGRTALRQFPALQRIRPAGGLWRRAARWKEWPEACGVLECTGGMRRVTIECAPRPVEMADLIRRIRHDGRIRHVRDAEYLAWRFQNPLQEYRFLFVEGGSGLDGYLVLQRAAGDVAGRVRVQIVDWEAIRADVREDLIMAAAVLGRNHSLVTWTATLAPEALQALQRAEFVAIEPEATARGYPSVLVRSLRHDQPMASWAIGDRRLIELSNWDLRLIYSMSG
jgi:GNAT superfamily N-acetyltransferase